jgi:hypothetical protein
MCVRAHARGHHNKTASRPQRDRGQSETAPTTYIRMRRVGAVSARRKQVGFCKRRLGRLRFLSILHDQCMGHSVELRMNKTRLEQLQSPALAQPLPPQPAPGTATGAARPATRSDARNLSRRLPCPEVPRAPRAVPAGGGGALPSSITSANWCWKSQQSSCRHRIKLISCKCKYGCV